MRAASFFGTVLTGARPIAPRTQLCSITGVTMHTIRCASSKRGGSSSRYLQRQKSDVYVKQRSRPLGPKKSSTPADYLEDDDIGTSSGFVARSAFKLLQLDDRYKFLRPGRVIVDLGAAPGGWSQAIVERTRSRSAAGTGKGNKGSATPVFALDLLPVVDIDGVTSIQGDFLDGTTQERLRKLVADAALGNSNVEQGGERTTVGFVDVVVSDMMANTTGNPIVDTEASLELCRAAASFAFQTLKQDPQQSSNVERKSPVSLASKSSVLVMKYFMSHEADVFRKEVLERHFRFVKAEKMDASRKESREQFWICIGHKGLPPS
ncbi:related to MRM2 - mitochondrial rRNA methyl transferase [Ustilago trichophora]|uniref:rRNA methyltransferase 2, mitochondrial n=1 Tax=Ustilago trichophora TaxID=86804 RepID=A0A5C3DWV6_9BASI|nr:related to MRM2 - mitochondrial rRNA methyl transferase [Ustilago trichophora]